MPFSDTHTAKWMKKENVDVVNTIIDEFAKIRLSPSAECRHDYEGGWMKFGTYFQFYYDTGEWREAILSVIKK